MMAEALDDGEFWLPSEILTDSDEDETLAASTRSPFKGGNLSSSPQSTLCWFATNHDSSRGSPVGPVSPPPAVGEDNGASATWDLLYKAAGEVARMKLRRQTAAKVGTGFFDCSAKRPLCPPPPVGVPPTVNYNNNYLSSVHHPSHIRQQQQYNRGGITRSENVNKNSSNRPLGLPPSAWPPLQAQKPQPISVNGPTMLMGQPKRESVGTGVFLPRRPSVSSNKPEINGVRMRSGKGSLKSQQQKVTSRPPTANPKPIQLPQEWTY